MGWLTLEKFFLQQLAVATPIVPDSVVVVPWLKDSGHTLFLGTLMPGRKELVNGQSQTLWLDVHLLKFPHHRSLGYRHFGT
jgi:hypothetical protein